MPIDTGRGELRSAMLVTLLLLDTGGMGSLAVQRTHKLLLKRVLQVGRAICAAGNVDPERLLEVLEFPQCALPCRRRLVA